MPETNSLSIVFFVLCCQSTHSLLLCQVTGRTQNHYDSVVLELHISVITLKSAIAAKSAGTAAHEASSTNSANFSELFITKGIVAQHSSFERRTPGSDRILAELDLPGVDLLMLRLDNCVRHSSRGTKLTAVKCVEIGGCDSDIVQLAAGQAVENREQAESVLLSAEVADVVWYVEEKLLSAVVGSMP